MTQKAALVTGGARGIGRAIAGLLAERGYARDARRDRQHRFDTGAAVRAGHRGVRANCISPGWIAFEKVSRRDHAQHPVGRVGRSDDIAELDAAGFITGQNFVVHGGMTRRMIYA